MIISKIYNNLTKSEKEDFGFEIGLMILAGFFIGGFIGGLAGIIPGFIFTILMSLCIGIVITDTKNSNVRGFIGGFISLGCGILINLLFNFSESFPFIKGFLPVLGLIGIIILIAEIMHWNTKEKKPKKNVFWYTCKRKIENIFEVILCVSVIGSIYVLIRDVDIIKYFPIILKLMGYIGLSIIALGIVVGVFYLWIRVNMLKYKDDKK